MTRKFVTAGRVFSITFIPVVLFYFGFFMGNLVHFKNPMDSETADYHCLYVKNDKAIDLNAPKLSDGFDAYLATNKEKVIDVTAKVSYLLNFGAIVFGTAFSFFLFVFMTLMINAETTLFIFPIAMPALGISNAVILVQVI